ncbi:MAG: protein-disulfide reductase DsbD domain-containing protein [Devosia sp.]
MCFPLSGALGYREGMRTVIPSLAVALLFASPAFAAATPWQEVAPSTRLRLISSDVLDADGTTLVGLDLDMPEGYKTYWRLPGETGIPTQFDTTGSTGVGAPALEWPFPVAEKVEGFLDYVYHGQTVLPVRLAVKGTSPMLEASVAMGVCSQVCVPIKAHFALPLSFAAADPAESIRLKQAESLVPIPWDRGDPPFEGVAFDPASAALRLTVTDPHIDPGSIIASTADPTVIFDTPQKSPDGRSFLLPLRARDVGSKWAQSPVRLTFMTDKGSYEVSERVTLSKP